MEEEARRTGSGYRRAAGIALQALLCTWAIQDCALQEIVWGYEVDIPVVKWFFALFKNMGCWGMESIFSFAGICCIIYFAGREPSRKSVWLNGACVFFGFCTVIGRSYYACDSWYYVIHGRVQFANACLAAAGYALLYRYLLLLGLYAIKKGRLLEEGEAKTGRLQRVRTFLFEKHSYKGPLLVIAVCQLPYWIAFFPGTLQWDAHAQIWAYLGVIPWDALHPPVTTWLMGTCVSLSRLLFGSDSMGLAFYVGPQLLIQWLVFAYGMFLLGKMKAPDVFRWGTLLYLALFPAWAIWGVTVVKDTYYYIYALLFVLAFMDIMQEQGETEAEEAKGFWRKYGKWLLLTLGVLGMCLTRYNGMYIVVFTAAAVFVLGRKYWKIGLIGLLFSVVPVMVQNQVVVPALGIQKGPVRETLSLPLQQTARYVLYHKEEITQEERELLAPLFQVDLEELAGLYEPEISDPVKAQFIKYPTKEQLGDYFKVWSAQLKKHPATYVQAFLNHTYGYYDPDREWFWEGIGCYYIGNAQHWEDGHLDMEFAFRNREGRDFLQKSAELFYQLPVVGMLYSPGLQNYILLGCFLYLLANRKRESLLPLLPAAGVSLMNLLSPVNAYVRYMLPVMAMLPFLAAWSYRSVHRE